MFGFVKAPQRVYRVQHLKALSLETLISHMNKGLHPFGEPCLLFCNRVPQTDSGDKIDAKTSGLAGEWYSLLKAHSVWVHVSHLWDALTLLFCLATVEGTVVKH